MNNKKKKNVNGKGISILRVIGLFFIIVFCVMGLSYYSIISEKNATIDHIHKTEAIVILGAGLWGDQVSPQLGLRLQTAYDLMASNRNLKVIVSGGQGADELTSEANAMKLYLVALGADEKKIYLEDQSTSTVENLTFSFKIIKSLGISSDKIAVVTTDFHIYRSKFIAKRLGYTIQGHAAPNIESIALKNTAREVIALIKDFLTCF